MEVEADKQKENGMPEPTATSVLETAPGYLPAGTLHERTVHGTRTRWWEYGQPNADVLVLVHGFRGDHHGLETIAAHLSHYRVLIPDLPGFGRTEPIPGAEHTVSTYAGWLADFLTTAVGAPVHLVGHSFGSIITSYLAAARPEAITRLTLINPICQPALESDQKLVSVLAELYYRAGAALPTVLGFPLLRSQLITRLSSEFMMKTKDPALRAFINGQHAAYFGAFVSRDAVLEAYRASIGSTAAEFAPAIPRPVQMIVAEKDNLGTLDAQRTMFSTLQEGRFDLIPEVGHLIHYETPARAAALIYDFHQEAA